MKHTSLFTWVRSQVAAAKPAASVPGSSSAKDSPLPLPAAHCALIASPNLIRSSCLVAVSTGAAAAAAPLFAALIANTIGEEATDMVGPSKMDWSWPRASLIQADESGIHIAVPTCPGGAAFGSLSPSAVTVTLMHWSEVSGLVATHRSAMLVTA